MMHDSGDEDLRRRSPHCAKVTCDRLPGSTRARARRVAPVNAPRSRPLAVAAAALLLLIAAPLACDAASPRAQGGARELAIADRVFAALPGERSCAPFGRFRIHVRLGEVTAGHNE